MLVKCPPVGLVFFFLCFVHPLPCAACRSCFFDRQRGIDHVLVEGGPSVARSFLAEGLVDRAVIIRAPVEFSRPVPSDIEAGTLLRYCCMMLYDMLIKFSFALS